MARSEKAMLKEIFKGLHEQFGLLDDWMDVLVMDRSYWGAEFGNYDTDNFSRRAAAMAISTVPILQNEIYRTRPG